jgi:hypothetical protein
MNIFCSNINYWYLTEHVIIREEEEGKGVYMSWNKQETMMTKERKIILYVVCVK